MLKFKKKDKVYIVSEWHDGSIQITFGVIKDWSPSGYSFENNCTVYPEKKIFANKDEAMEEFKKWLNNAESETK